MVRGASEHLPQLQGLVQPSQDRAAEAGYEVEAIIAELEKADALAAPLEEPAVTARSEHAALAQQLAIARSASSLLAGLTFLDPGLQSSASWSLQADMPHCSMALSSRLGACGQPCLPLCLVYSAALRWPPNYCVFEL